MIGSLQVGFYLLGRIDKGISSKDPKILKQLVLLVQIPTHTHKTQSVSLFEGNYMEIIPTIAKQQI